MDMRIAGNSSALLIFRYEHPTKQEIFSFEYGAVKISLRREEKLMIVMADIDGVGTSDCVYHLDRFQHDRVNWIRTEKGQGMAVHIMVVDEKNILRASRMLGVSSEFTNYFADIIEYQQTEEGRIHNGEREFVELGINVYTKYPTIESVPIDVSYVSSKKGVKV